MDNRTKEKLEKIAKKKGFNLIFRFNNPSEKYNLYQEGILIRKFRSIKDLTNFLKYHDPSKARVKQLSLFEN